MKLSKKGLKRLLEVAFDGDEFYQANALEVEFEPDDFVGGCCQNGNDHIVLTVDEARKLHTVVRDAMMASWEIKYGGKVPLTMLSTDEFDFLCERIRQAEKCNE